MRGKPQQIEVELVSGDTQEMFPVAVGAVNVQQDADSDSEYEGSDEVQRRRAPLASSIKMRVVFDWAKLELSGVAHDVVMQYMLELQRSSNIRSKKAGKQSATAKAGKK